MSIYKYIIYKLNIKYIINNSKYIIYKLHIFKPKGHISMIIKETMKITPDLSYLSFVCEYHSVGAVKRNFSDFNAKRHTVESFLFVGYSVPMKFNDFTGVL